MGFFPGKKLINSNSTKYRIGVPFAPLRDVTAGGRGSLKKECTANSLALDYHQQPFVVPSAHERIYRVEKIGIGDGSTNG